MRKIFAGTAAVLAAVLFLSCPAGAISARKAIVMDGLTGRVLYEKQADEKSLIASTTKIMTALLVCENCNVLDIVEIPPAAVGSEGSSMYLQAGERLSIQELLYGMMLHSGNDAATALALHCGGDIAAFSEMMNAKARELGMENSHFVNPHGLDAADHYSTARDLAILAAHALKNPIFAQTVSTKSIRTGNRYLTNHNKLLWRVEGADGVKTGYTKAAGRILVSSAQRQGRHLIVVTIDDGNDWADHAALYDRGFARYSPRQLVVAGQVLGHMDVFGGREGKVPLVAVEDFSFPTAAGEQVSFRFSADMTFAPAVEGAAAGFAYVCIDGQSVGKVALEFGRTVEMEPEPEKKTPWWRRFGEEK